MEINLNKSCHNNQRWAKIDNDNQVMIQNGLTDKSAWVTILFNRSQYGDYQMNPISFWQKFMF